MADMFSTSFHKQVNILLKVLGHSCEIENNGSFTRSKLLSAYIFSIFAGVLYLYDIKNFEQVQPTFNRAVVMIYLALLIFSYLMSLIQEREYRTLLQYVTELKEAIDSEVKLVTSITVIASFYTLLLLDVTCVVMGYYALYAESFRRSYISLAAILVLFLGSGSFARALVLVTRYLSLSRIINTKTRASVADLDAVKGILSTVMTIQMNFSRLNLHISPYLLVTLSMSFTAVFHYPFVLVSYISRSDESNPFHLIVLSAFLKFYMISNLCHQVNDEMNEWWRIVEDTPGFIEDMLFRGITPCTAKRKFNVYDLFDVDRTLIKNMLLAILSYAFLVAQMSPRFNLFIKWLESPMVSWRELP